MKTAIRYNKFIQYSNAPVCMVGDRRVNFPKRKLRVRTLLRKVFGKA